MKPTFVSCVFFSPYHLFTDWITVAPVKKQIALAQGQDHSPGALPTSPEFTLNAELTISLLHSLKLPPAMMEGCQALSSYTMFTLSLPPILLSFFHLCGLHLTQFKGKSLLLAQPCFAFSNTAQTCQHTSLCISSASAFISPAPRSPSSHTALGTFEGLLAPAPPTILELTHCKG